VVVTTRLWKVIWALEQVKAVLEQVQALTQAFMPDEMLMRVVNGQGEPWVKSQEEIQGRFDLMLAFDPQDLDMEKLQLKGRIYRDIVLATDREQTVVTAPVTQALVGAAAMRGLLNPDNAIGHPHWRAGDPRGQITWRQWLQMTDGLGHVELLARGVGDNGAARMIFGPHRRDTISYVTGLPLAHPPGTHWNYSTAGITLVADALTHRLAPGAAPLERRERMAAFMREGLFDPIGMRSAMGEFDAEGTFQGGSFVWASAPDWARFGYLYLRDGLWDGRRVLRACVRARAWECGRGGTSMLASNRRRPGSMNLAP
jgi:hypothetical protein